MLSVVPGQLVRSGEPPPATLPAAYVGLLARVGPMVGLEVAGLGVSLAAPVVVAGVDGHLLGPVALFPAPLFQWHHWGWGWGRR